VEEKKILFQQKKKILIFREAKAILCKNGAKKEK